VHRIEPNFGSDLTEFFGIPLLDGIQPEGEKGGDGICNKKN